MALEEVKAWEAFSWQQKLSEIENTVSSSKDAREQSLQARKLLADTTKQFKKSIKTLQQASTALQADGNEANVSSVAESVDDITKECREIVKAYKDEIDNLTRRCKSSETAYGSLGQALKELSDPSKLTVAYTDQLSLQNGQIDQLSHTVQNLTSEMEKQEQTHQRELEQLRSKSAGSATSKKDHEELIDLRREVAEYEVEFRSLKNQDIKIRKLEARIAELQTTGEEQLKDQFEKAKEELAEVEGRRVTEALEREASMARKVQTLELQLKAERAGREATQEHLLEADEGVSRREAAWEAQRMILVGDTERLREELHCTTRERDELNLKLGALKDKTVTAPVSGGVSVQELMLERSAYEAEVAELSETAAHLRDEIRQKEENYVSEKRSMVAKIDLMEREKSSVESKVMSLENQLSSAPSQEFVEKMSRELRILKKLEYNAVDNERDPEIAGINEEDADLESVLVAKLKRAESELVAERVAKSELSNECQSLRLSAREAEKAQHQAESLVSSLENDLAQAISSPTPKLENDASMPRTVPSENPATLQSVLDPNAPVPPSPPALKTVESAAAKEKADDDHSVATIVMAQRDRLRARCESLEAERDSFKRELQGQVQASESLKTDNMKLYEKVRYLQNFKGSSTTRAPSRDLDLEALEQRYEASVDPFKQFSKTERQRKLNEMSPMERTVFVVARTFLATKEMRTALFFYVVILHMLVFSTTFHWSHADQCSTIDLEHLSHLPPNHADHIRADLHGENASP